MSEGEWLLNPGGVGQPRDGDPRAAWLLLDTDGVESPLASRGVPDRRGRRGDRAGGPAPGAGRPALQRTVRPRATTTLILALAAGLGGRLRLGRRAERRADPGRAGPGASAPARVDREPLPVRRRRLRRHHRKRRPEHHRGRVRDRLAAGERRPRRARARSSRASTGSSSWSRSSATTRARSRSSRSTGRARADADADDSARATRGGGRRRGGGQRPRPPRTEPTGTEPPVEEVPPEGTTGEEGSGGSGQGGSGELGLGGGGTAGQGDGGGALVPGAGQ